jgi:hypothetical protein
MSLQIRSYLQVLLISASMTSIRISSSNLIARPIHIVITSVAVVSNETLLPELPYGVFDSTERSVSCERSILWSYVECRQTNSKKAKFARRN